MRGTLFVSGTQAPLSSKMSSRSSKGWPFPRWPPTVRCSMPQIAVTSRMLLASQAKTWLRGAPAITSVSIPGMECLTSRMSLRRCPPFQPCFLSPREACSQRTWSCFVSLCLRQQSTMQTYLKASICCLHGVLSTKEPLSNPTHLFIPQD